MVADVCTSLVCPFTIYPVLSSHSNRHDTAGVVNRLQLLQPVDNTHSHHPLSVPYEKAQLWASFLLQWWYSCLYCTERYIFTITDLVKTYHLKLDLNTDGSTFDASHARCEDTASTGHTAQWRTCLRTNNWTTHIWSDGGIARCQYK